MHIRENYTWFNLIIFNHLISISAFYPQNCCLNLHNFSLKFPGLPWSSKGSPKEPPKMASLCAASCNGVKPSTFSARCPAANRASTHWMEVEISWRVGVLVVVSKRLENYTELYPKKNACTRLSFRYFIICLLSLDPWPCKRINCVLFFSLYIFHYIPWSNPKNCYLSPFAKVHMDIYHIAFQSEASSPGCFPWNPKFAG